MLDSSAEALKYNEPHATGPWYWNFSKEDTDRHLAGGHAPQRLMDEYVALRGKLEPLVEKFSGMGKSTKRKRRYEIEGDEIDVDRAMVGTPECWVRRRRGAQRRMVHLGVGYFWNSGARSEHFTRFAALAAAAADVLQILGYAVEITAIGWGEPTRDNRSAPSAHMGVGIKLKEPLEPLDPQRILICGHSGLFRGHLFEFNRSLGYSPDYTTTRALDKRTRETFGIDYLVGTDRAWPEGKEAPELEGFFTQAEGIASGQRYLL